MRIGLAQINCHLGDFKKNSEKILSYIHKAKDRRCDLVVFPEATLFGYHPMDLLERDSVVEEQLRELKKLTKKIPAGIGILIGGFTRNKKENGKPYHNAAVFLEKGKRPLSFHKELLPTYDVFDEARHIEPGHVDKNIFRFKGKKILVTICEDIWAWKQSASHKSLYKENPILRVRPGAVDLCLNLSASPFFLGKAALRKHVVAQTAKHLRVPMVYVNMMGAQDELIFDGGSFAVNKKGQVIAQSARFEEEINYVDLTEMRGWVDESKPENVELLRKALVLGIRDFVHKTGMNKVHLGLSGGIDSAVVACLAVDALGPENVVGIAMPGPYNSPVSLSLAKSLAKNLGIKIYNMPIHKLFQSAKAGIDKTFKVNKFGLVHENLQSRIRALNLMAYSNANRSLLLNTSNKSELASGYGTLYGDLCGALSPIGDLLKENVYELAEHYNSENEIIPKKIITRPPSAELRPNQKDSDSLPAYNLLDESVIHLIEKGRRATTKSDKFLLKALFNSEFKRWQSPPILKVREHSFGQGRRMPLAHVAKN